MEWISVEDELPKECEEENLGMSKEVLVYGYNDFNGKNIMTVGWLHVNMVSDGWGCDLGTGGSTFQMKVTHWMPLPEPPK